MEKKEEIQYMVLNGNILIYDLLYFGSYNEKNELETFRYTQNQRRLETRNKKYNKKTINKINNIIFNYKFKLK